MEVTFHVSTSSDKANMMILEEIDDKSKLEAIKSMIETSDLLFIKLTERTYTLHSLVGESPAYTAYDLFVHLPYYDKYSVYGNFQYLFKNDKYLNWKKAFVAQFPEFSNEFTHAEKRAENRQELLEMEETLKRFKQENKRYISHFNDNYIKSLEQRIIDLRQALSTRSEQHFNPQ